MIRISSILFIASCLVVAVYVYYSSALYTAQKPERVVENLVRDSVEKDQSAESKKELRIGFPEGVMARLRDEKENEAGLWQKTMLNAIPLSEVSRDSLQDSLSWITLQHAQNSYELELVGAHESAVVVMYDDQPSTLIQIDSHNPSSLYVYLLSIDPTTNTLHVEHIARTL